MKKLILLISILFISTSFANSESKDYSKRIHGDSFNFIHEGIQFMVYKNGEFDFFIEPDNFVAAEFHNNSVNITYNSGYNYDAYVQYDDYGAIIQIENTPIYYDFYGRVSSIGETRIQYRNNRLVRFGSMHVFYNNYGQFDYYRGYINPFNRYVVYRPYFSFYVRPLFNHCIVSHNPYRRHYTPRRLAYRSNAYNHYLRNRRSTINNNRRYARKTIPNRIARSTRKPSRIGSERNSVTRRNTTSRTNRSITTRKGTDRVQTTRNLNSTTRINRSIKDNTSRTRKTVSRKPNRTSKSIKTVQRSSSNRSIASRINPNKKRSTISRSTTYRKSTPSRSSRTKSSSRRR